MQELLDLALDKPAEARRRAEQVLAQDPGPLERSYACQALGIVIRDLGLPVDATKILRDGVRAAVRSGDKGRVRDVRATLGTALVLSGRTTQGLRELEAALSGASGVLAAKIAMRKAGMLTLLGREAEAAPVLRDALEVLRSAENRDWEARTRVWLGTVELRLGNLDAAEFETAAALQLLVDVGASIDRLSALCTSAEIAVARGDIATGLRRYEAALRYERESGRDIRFDEVRLVAEAYLAAGLAEDGVAWLEDFEGAIGGFDRADHQLAEAGARLAADDPAGALVSARDAIAMFRRQGRPWFERRARLIAVRARYVLGQNRGLARAARQLAGELRDEHAEEAPVALTLAGRLATGAERRTLWQDAASYRKHPHGLVRAGARLAEALEREECGDRPGVLRASAAGLDAIDEHRRLMGSSELRALATTHGRELTTLALRHAAHDPRTLLRWSERTRATALAQPPATSDAATIPASLAALRDNGRQLAEARQAGEPTEQLEKERLRLERAVRAEHHTLAPGTEETQRPATAEEVVAGVSDGCLVELVDVDGVLHVLVVHDGRVRRRIAGTTAEVADLLGPTAMLMRRASRGRAASLDDLARQLQESALGEAARLIPDGPLVLSPTARLHGVPWALLPALSDRPFSVVPSAGQWLRARSVRRPRARRTALVSGPGLASGGAEVPVLAERYRDAVLLAGGDASVEATLKALDGADLAHLAAHGRFRADSPLFSALELADGPLVVHDLERLRRAPYRVVLSACESGVLAPVGAEEVLGLAAALISLGTSGLVCSVADVNDDATARLMVRLHDELAAGADPAAALLATRRAMADDPVAAATAAAFVALGA